MSPFVGIAMDVTSNPAIHTKRAASIQNLTAPCTARRNCISSHYTVPPCLLVRRARTDLVLLTWP